MAASIFESEMLAARVDGYSPSDLDALCAAGEVVWCGIESVGERDGRLALYLTDHLPRLRMLPKDVEVEGLERAILDHLEREGASFFAALHRAAGDGYPAETVDALWNLVWKGLITNDTFHAVRAFTRAPERRTRKASSRTFRTRRVSPPSAEGRWSLVAQRIGQPVSQTEWSTSVAQQLLSRYGVLTREVAGAEGIYGGFSAVYDVLKALEDAGRIRRGYFVGGVGATQFALPAALELMRSLRDEPDEPEVVLLAATDPANPFGTMLKWPATVPHGGNDATVQHGSTRFNKAHGLPAEALAKAGSTRLGDAGPVRGATRTVGAQVILVNGHLAAYLSRGGRQILAWLPEDEPQRSAIARPLARQLAAMARLGGLIIADVGGVPAGDHPLAPFLVEAGFNPSAMGFMMRREPVSPKPEPKARA
jgi:ATP-dependent Lhr-like helicase